MYRWGKRADSISRKIRSFGKKNTTKCRKPETTEENDRIELFESLKKMEWTRENARGIYFATLWGVKDNFLRE